ncbi:MAG: hypothetical protein C4293_18575, partial [Nitrospiraceae bacterium]
MIERMRRPYLHCLTLLLSIVGCALSNSHHVDSPQSLGAAAVNSYQPVVARLERDVREEIRSYVAAPQVSVIKALSDSNSFPAGFKLPAIVQGLTDPWRGIATLEQYGLRIAEVNGAGQDRVYRLLQALEAGTGRMQDRAMPVERSAHDHPDDPLAYLLAVLQEAHALREQAVQKLSFEERRFLFQHAASIVEHFIPQIADPNEPAVLQAKADLRFCRLVAEQVDSAALLAAAQVLTRFADTRRLRQMQAAFADAPVVTTSLSGMTGDILLVQETPYGLIIIGGTGPNRYHLHQRVALLVDLGGDDVYHGLIAAAADPHHGTSVVIDLSGNDTYYAAPLGLATGRLGVGLLIDR